MCSQASQEQHKNKTSIAKTLIPSTFPSHSHTELSPWARNAIQLSLSTAGIRSHWNASQDMGYMPRSPADVTHPDNEHESMV